MSDWNDPALLAEARKVVGCGKADTGEYFKGNMHEVAHEWMDSCDDCLVRLGQFFGDRAIRDAVAAMPAWSEDPDYVVASDKDGDHDGPIYIHKSVIRKAFGLPTPQEGT